jgi:ATP-dependent DNA ligase
VRVEEVRPHFGRELVAEVAFDGVQTSVRYPGGVALRFARVKGYRLDKSPRGHNRNVRAIHEDRM